MFAAVLTDLWSANSTLWSQVREVRRWEGAQGGRKTVADSLGTVIAHKVNEHHVSVGALHERANGAVVISAGDEVTFLTLLWWVISGLS